MTVAIAPVLQYFDNAGNPLSGGKVFTYTAGTLTPLASYTDRSGSTPNANPVILDSSGRADIWLSTNVAYKIILQDSAGNVIDSVDNYYAGADPSQLVAAGIVPATGGTYTGLVSFTGGVTFDGTPAQDLATLDSLGIASVQIANLWMNSDFAINQRIATTAADGAYGFDRTLALCETGSLTLSQLAQPTDGIPYAMRLLQPDATPKRIGSLQIVESRNCLAYRGSSLVFAPKVRCSVAATVRVALVAWTGTIDAPTRDVVNNWASTTYTAGNFFVANTLPIAVGATAVTAGVWTDVAVSSASAGGVVVPSTLNNLYMVFWTDAAVAQNVTLDASVMRAGKGTSLPLWTPPDAEVEIAKCMRYTQYFVGSGGGGVCATGGGEFTQSFHVPMRIPPTYANGGNGTVLDGLGAISITGASLATAGVSSARISFTAAGTTPGRGANVVSQTSAFYAEF